MRTTVGLYASNNQEPMQTQLLIMGGEFVCRIVSRWRLLSRISRKVTLVPNGVILSVGGGLCRHNTGALQKGLQQIGLEQNWTKHSFGV